MVGACTVPCTFTRCVHVDWVLPIPYTIIIIIHHHHSYSPEDIVTIESETGPIQIAKNPTCRAGVPLQEYGVAVYWMCITCICVHLMPCTHTTLCTHTPVYYPHSGTLPCSLVSGRACGRHRLCLQQCGIPSHEWCAAGNVASSTLQLLLLHWVRNQCHGTRFATIQWYENSTRTTHSPLHVVVHHTTPGACPHVLRVYTKAWCTSMRVQCACTGGFGVAAVFGICRSTGTHRGPATRPHCSYGGHAAGYCTTVQRHQQACGPAGAMHRCREAVCICRRCGPCGALYGPCVVVFACRHSVLLS